MCQGEKNLRGAMAMRVWVLHRGIALRIAPRNGAVPLDLKDGQTEGPSHGPWLGSSTKLLAVSPVLGETRVAVWIFHSSHPLWGGEWAGKPAWAKQSSGL